MTDILQLAASGLSIGEIARAAQVDPATAVIMINQAMADQLKLSQDEARLLESVHLDMIRAALTPYAMQGSAEAARILVRVHQAKASLLDLAYVTPAIPEDGGEDDLDRIRQDREARRASTD
jgi:hypothetical protein